MKAVPKYRRVLLKVSGEALMGTQSYGIDVGTVERIATDIKEASDAGAQICLVIGGGKIFRGLQSAAAGIDPAPGRFNGMIAPHIKTIFLQGGAGRRRPAPPRPVASPTLLGLRAPLSPRAHL